MWKTRSFNIVIPAFPNSPPDEVVIAMVRDGTFGTLPLLYRLGSRCLELPGMIYIRFSLPYKIGEEEEPGNVDEKVRSEAATCIWLQENCPDVPIPSLLGFGLPDGQCVGEMLSIQSRPTRRILSKTDRILDFRAAEFRSCCSC